MPTFVIIAIACAVAVGQSPATDPLEQSLLRVLLTFGTMLVSCLMARIMVVACLDVTAVVPTANQASEKRRARWERWHLLVWLGMTAFLLFGVGWGTIVRINWQLNSAILLDEILILAPLLLPWLVSWAYFYDLDAKSSVDSLQRRWKYALQHGRIVFGLGLLPVFAVSLISDTARMVTPELADKPIPTGVFVIPMALLILGYPLILRRLWKTSRLPAGDTRSKLVKFAGDSQIRLKELYLWNTGGKTMNAAVTGAIPQMRYLFFTDALLEQLPESEVLAAMAHEFGHLKHRHLIVRMAALFFPVTAIVALGGIVNFASHGNTPAANGLGSSLSISVPPEFFAVATAGIAVIYLWQVIGGYSRRLEMQADLAGWQLLSKHLGCPKQAGAIYTSMLRRVSEPDGQGTWLHPPITHRIDLVNHAADGKLDVSRWSRGLQWVEWLLLTTTALAVFLMLAGY